MDGPINNDLLRKEGTSRSVLHGKINPTIFSLKKNKDQKTK